MITLKEYLLTENKNIFLKTQQKIIFEGGQATENLLKELINNSGNINLKYTRATPTQNVLDEIDNLYNILVDNNFIEPEKPSFILGSSRLFAIATGIKQPETNEYETPDVINKALNIKKTYGDIDLDVSYKPGVTPQIIKTFINNHNKSKYISDSFGNEVSVATVLDGTNNVIQIDIVNISSNKKYMEFSQFSSIADTAENIKGLVRDILIKIIAKTHPIPAEQKEAIITFLKNTDQYKRFALKWKNKNPDISVRYSLSNDGLLFKIKWIKDGKTTSYQEAGVKFEKLTQLLDDPSVRPQSYEKIDAIANMLGFDNPEQMKHVTSMIKTISSFDTERKQKIWDSLVENLSDKIPNPEKGRNVGQISKEEAEYTLKYLAPYFGNDINTSNQDLTKIDEALSMTSIPHFEQMTIPQIIDFFEDENWEITEKADGANVAFGIDENGIYVKSKKGNPVYDPQEYVNLSITYNNDIHLGFAEFLKFLNNNKELFLNFYNKYNDVLGNIGFQMFGELFSKSHMNVIAYSDEKIGKGSVYVFMVKSDINQKGNDVTNSEIGRQIIQEFIQTFQGVNGWNFYSKRPVEINLSKIKIKDQLLNLINNNREILSSRKKVDKHQKDILKDQIAKLLMDFKADVLSQTKGTSSILGAKEIEGIIVRNLKNGSLAKIVNLEDFGARRVEQWAGIDKIKELRKNLYNKIQNEILDNADIFILPEKQKEKLFNELEVRGSKYQSVEDMLNVLYNDAVIERPRLKSEFNNILSNLKNILINHIENAKNIINDVDASNDKTFNDTQNAINAEVKNINGILDNIQNINKDTDFYIEVIKFFIGYKGLENLINTFLK